MSDVRYFGIRHHGPGSARSLVRALEALRPDCVLVEGPPEADGLVSMAAAEGMTPPVALLSYCPDESSWAVYHPFAEFSPEWQALRWAVAAKATLRFIDLPRANDFALEKARREAIEARMAEAAEGEGDQDGVQAKDQDSDASSTSGTSGANGDAGDAMDASSASDTSTATLDPLDWLARAAGYADGESWWNHMVEERGDGEQLFAAITEAMVALREDLGDAPNRDPEDVRREALREATMRQCVRAARKEGFERIAVVVGAWHLGGLTGRAADQITAKADTALLKGLPKAKAQCTWVPWTYRHLARASGYGAGIHSPGWYEHLWRTDGSPTGRATGWLARIARLMRERDLDCSSAHLIEATRLAESLAAMRLRPAPSLDELNDATRAVLTLGDDTVLAFVRDALIVGDRLGSVPADVPTVPLQRDLEAAQKSLRLKPEALQKSLDLDLRNANDLARSHLLHRLNLLGIDWGSLAKVGRSSRGSFHEVWSLQWQPEFALRVIEASRWGQTVAQAATASTVDRCAKLESLAALAEVVDATLLAELPEAAAAATRALQDRAAVSGDVAQLLEALPPLANVFRYGNVRGTDAALVGGVLDGLIVRAAIGLPMAAMAIDDDAALALRERILAAHAAVGLRDGGEQTASWQRALSLMGLQLTATGAGPAAGGSGDGHAGAPSSSSSAATQGVHAMLQGLAVRLLLDAGTCNADDTSRAMSLNLSSAVDPSRAAAWLDGFVNRNATVLLHDATVFGLLDAWLATLTPDHFQRVLPLVRRGFSAFGPGERRDLAQRATQGAKAAPAVASVVDWDEARAVRALPLLRRLMGLQI